MLSSDPEQQNNQPIVGRTGYDVLASSKLFILLILFFVVGIVCIVLYPNAVVSSLNFIISAISENISYVIPILLGFWSGRYIFRRWIDKDIVVLVEPLDAPTYCVFFSEGAFAQFTRINGMLNPEPTLTGRPMYRAKSIDFEQRLINGGWIHEKKTSPSMVFTRKRMFYKLLENYRKALEKVLELTDIPFVRGTEYGKKYVEKNIELMESVIFGETSDPLESIEVVPLEDVVSEVVSND